MSTILRVINVNEIKSIVKELCIIACTDIDPDLKEAFLKSRDSEESPVGKAVLEQLLKNADIAQSESIPICQDTGFTVIFMEIGQDVTFTGGYLYDAVEEGVRTAYVEGYLRRSIVKNPLTMLESTGDNTPPVIHTDIIPGDSMKITVLPKGGESENMSRIRMMKPADGLEGVKIL